MRFESAHFAIVSVKVSGIYQTRMPLFRQRRQFTVLQCRVGRMQVRFATMARACCAEGPEKMDAEARTVPRAARSNADEAFEVFAIFGLALRPSLIAANRLQLRQSPSHTQIGVGPKGLRNRPFRRFLLRYPMAPFAVYRAGP
jgi:hypothetical protein